MGKNKRMRKTVWGLCIGLAVAFCMPISLPAAMAARDPVFTSNLGGTPISCSIYSEQAAVDGVHTGDSQSQLIQKLEMPTSTYRKNQGSMTYYYKGMKINLADFSGSGLYTVTDIETSTAGHYTPDGVGVGMNEQILSDVYGTADSVWTKTYVSPKLSDEVNRKNQARFNETVYTYNVNEGLSMSFIVKQGIISKISIHQSK